MKPLAWSPTFETGIAEIDEDHRRLFALAESIRDSMTRQDRNHCVALVHEFIGAAENHFAKEEAILDRADYPEAGAHKSYHAKLQDKATRLKQVCDVEQDPQKAKECYDELIVFLIDDVVRGDTQFKSHLEERGYTRGRR